MMRRAVPVLQGSDTFSRSLASHLRDNRGSFGSEPSKAAPSQPASGVDPHEVSAHSFNLRARHGDADPLGGMYHPSFYRDPAEGHAPQSAPRNFADGGAPDYYHPSSSLHYEQAEVRRDAAEHEHYTRHRSSAAVREAVRQGTRPPVARTPAPFRVGSDPNLMAAVSEVATHRGYSQTPEEPLMTEQYVPHLGGLPRDRLASVHNDSADAANADVLREVMRGVHGFREQERFDAEYRQRFDNANRFVGYDVDRVKAYREGRLYGAPEESLVPPSSMSEAQTSLRSSGVPPERQQQQRIMHDSSQWATPLIGEDLTKHVLKSKHALNRTSQRAAKRQHDDEFGLGRQGPLVSDGAPDRRKLNLHKNDERLIHAAEYSAMAYADRKEASTNPYTRRDISNGVGSVLTTKWDKDRRVDKSQQGKADVADRGNIFYGVPIKQQVDTQVRKQRNKRSDRPIEYFMPFPKQQDLQLNSVHDDVEGFPLFGKARLDHYEWDLFERYRMHHEQRRRIAVQHNLEPKVNETATEREARRRKLDELCEATPCAGEGTVPTSELRRWFGAYFLPSPTIVQKANTEAVTSPHLNLISAVSNGQVDTREHVLSIRYLNRVLLFESFNQRINRGPSAAGTMPDPEVPLAQSAASLKHFSPKEREMYNEYIEAQCAKHEQKWQEVLEQRKWLPSHGMYGKMAKTTLSYLEVVDVRTIATQQRVTVLKETWDNMQEKEVNGEGAVEVSGSRRKGEFCRITLDNGEAIVMDAATFASYPNAVAIDDANEHLNRNATTSYPYNRTNYIEAQDYLWEQRVYGQEEGWSPATTADAMNTGDVVQVLRTSGGHSATPTRATIVQFQKQPFWNPKPHVVTVQYTDDHAIEVVPLSAVRVWQASRVGPDRTSRFATKKHSGGLRRYIDMKHPKKKAPRPHFLDVYLQYRSEEPESPFRSLQQITELDQWLHYDESRPENHRLLSVNHRKDFIGDNYMFHYTPWEHILHQESDQPLIKEDIASDNVGPSRFFSANRFWRYKRRPHAYVRNYDSEIRDFAQYVDSVVPWDKAKLLRTHGEVRQDHPTPTFYRPVHGMHRNNMAMLPTHLWDADKRTGKVKTLKETLQGYTSMTTPSWASM